MNKIIDTTWKEFKVKDIFKQITKGNVSNVGELPDGNDVFYCGAKKRNNGVMSYHNKLKKDVTKGNAFTFIGSGAGSAGYTLYQPFEFYASSSLVIGRADWLNKKTGLFLTTILDKNRFKYGYGRGWTLELVKNTTLPLPVDKDGKPDWVVIEQYMDSVLEKVNQEIKVKFKKSFI